MQKEFRSSRWFLTLWFIIVYVTILQLREVAFEATGRNAIAFAELLLTLAVSISKEPQEMISSWIGKVTYIHWYPLVFLKRSQYLQMDLESFIIQQYTEPAFPFTNTLISHPAHLENQTLNPEVVIDKYTYCSRCTPVSGMSHNTLH